MRQNHTRKLLQLATLASGLVLASSASAEVLLYTDFSTDGALTSQGWVAINGSGVDPVTAGGGTVGVTAIASGSGEDVTYNFATAATTGSLYFSAIVSSSVMTTAANGTYFLALYNTASSGGGYAARVFASTTTAGWAYGLSTSGTAPADWTSDATLDTFYNIVVKYDFTDRTAVMGVFAENYMPISDSELTLSGGTASSISTITGITIRQGTTVGGMEQSISSITVATDLASLSAIPEPSSFAALAGAAALGATALRRRKRSS